MSGNGDVRGAVDISDGICAYLQGGFGNQLFILAAAWQQATRLDCPLYVDVSRFLRRDRLEVGYETPRDFELAALDLPGTLIGVDSPWFANSPRRPALLRRPGRRSTRLAVVRDAAGPAAVATSRPGTTLFGYFQSPAFFGGIADDVAELLDDATLSSDDLHEVEALTVEPRLTVHLRRGDYLRADVAAHHGMVSIDYVRRALDLLERLTGDRRGRVYTDSPDVVRGELGDDSTLELVADPDRLGAVATIRAMSHGTGFVMSNSSFSWWAAFLMDRRSAVPVVAPRPWLASGDSAADLLLPGWFTVGAR